MQFYLPNLPEAPAADVAGVFASVMDEIDAIIIHRTDPVTVVKERGRRIVMADRSRFVSIIERLERECVERHALPRGAELEYVERTATGLRCYTRAGTECSLDLHPTTAT